jgi:hypothetical protein
MSYKIPFVKKKVKVNEKKLYMLYSKRSDGPIYRQQIIITKWVNSHKFTYCITEIYFENPIAKETEPGFVKRSCFRGNPG